MLAAAFAFFLAVGAVGAVGPGSARQDLQSDLLVTAGDGALWLVRQGERHAVAPQTVTADELARWPESAPYGAQIPPLLVDRAAEGTVPPIATSRPTGPAEEQREWRRVARWLGNGDKNTEPFVIQGGQWRITYTVRDPRSNTPRLCIAVRTIEAVHVDSGCYRQDDTTYVYRRGTFYLDISSADQWTVTVEDYY
jgi:hypothetical protein